MVYRVYQKGETKHVRQENKFLAKFVGLLATSCQEAYGIHPLLGTKPGFAREVVKMGDKPLAEVFSSRIWTSRVDLDDILGDIVDGEILHQWRGHLLDGSGWSESVPILRALEEDVDIILRTMIWHVAEIDCFL